MHRLTAMRNTVDKQRQTVDRSIGVGRPCHGNGVPLKVLLYVLLRWEQEVVFPTMSPRDNSGPPTVHIISLISKDQPR